jgi:pimeloyl-ACP methyl ester carboxylesterase
MTVLQIIGALIAFLLLVLGLIYWRADRETLSAAEFRADSGYQTAPLSHGVTAYQAFGPVDGAPVVIVHGGTLGSMAYQGYVPPLVEDGWRVIIYDQYGRGFSDRPNNKLTIDLMRLQLRDLLDHLQIDKAHFFGVSLGGAIIARFAAEHGDRVRSLAYQVPAIKGVEPTLALTLTRLPLLGQFLSRLVGIPAIIARGESFGTQSEESRCVVAHFTTQFKVKGTERMIRDMIIGDALSDRMADHEKIAVSCIAAQFVYALDDPEIMRADVEAALAFYENPDVHQYTGGHFFSTGRTEELSKKLTLFFQQR